MQNQNGYYEPRQLEIRDANYQGSLSWIHEIPTNGDPKRVLALISGQQIVASSDGRFVAFLVQSVDGSEIVEHNLKNVPKVHLVAGAGSRILEITESLVIVFGKPFNQSVTGVYRIDEQGLFLIEKIDEMVCQSSTIPFVLVGSSLGNRDKTILSNKFSFPVERDTKIVFLSDGSALLLENIDGTFYRYCVDQNGLIHDWSRVPVPRGDTPFAVVKWLGLYFLATGRKSKLFHLGSGGLIPREGLFLHGKLEEFWQSPNNESIAWLVSTHGAAHTFKSLYVNGSLVYKGEFDLSAKDLVWSPNGKMFGALVRVSFGGCEKQFIITQTIEREIITGQVVQEFLVDDNGLIAATIINNGQFSHPNVYVRPHDAVPIAWNLSWVPNGGIMYNSALITSSSVVLMRTTDETHFRR